MARVGFDGSHLLRVTRPIAYAESLDSKRQCLSQPGKPQNTDKIVKLPNVVLTVPPGLTFVHF